MALEFVLKKAMVMGFPILLEKRVCLLKEAFFHRHQ